MKINALILLLLLSTNIALAQKKEKIKGSKTVTIEQREIGNFENLEVEDNLEIYLEKGETNSLKIEADDNLQAIISADLSDKTLRLYTTKEATNYKKIIVRVTYTNDLTMVTSKNETTINAIQEIELEDITFKTFDSSKLFLNINTTNFLLQADDKSKMELNIKSENTTIELTKNATVKALISSITLNCDLYQKSAATLEGDVTNAIIRLDNNSVLTGNKLNLKNADVTTEAYSSCSIFAETNLIVDAANNSEIQLLGTPTIEIRKFADEAKLIKKLK